jgi:uncharacterized protein YicC (UPF0701 family)
MEDRVRKSISNKISRGKIDVFITYINNGIEGKNILINKDIARLYIKELEELANSIREKGVLQPILVRSVTGKSNQYEIIAGERRWRASKMAGLAEIPVLVKNMDEVEVKCLDNAFFEDVVHVNHAYVFTFFCCYQLSDFGFLH